MSSSCRAERISGSSALKVLVQQEELRVLHQRSRQPDALAHTATELVRELVLGPGQSHEVDQLLRHLFSVGTRDAGDLERIGHVTQHATMRKQPEVLEHHRPVPSANSCELLEREAEDFVAVDGDASGCGFYQARDAANQRGLAAAGEPHHDEGLAGPHLERDAVHGSEVSFHLALTVFQRLDRFFRLRAIDFPEILDHDGRPTEAGSLPGIRIHAVLATLDQRITTEVRERDTAIEQLRSDVRSTRSRDESERKSDARSDTRLAAAGLGLAALGAVLQLVGSAA